MLLYDYNTIFQILKDKVHTFYFQPQLVKVCLMPFYK